MMQMIHSGPDVFVVLVYNMREEILSQHLSRRKYGHFKIGDFFEHHVDSMHSVTFQ